MGPKKISISKETLEKLYISEKLNAYQIAGKLNCGSTTIYRKLSEYKIKRRDNSSCHIRYKRNQFSGDKKEKAYLIGFRLGDLHVRKAIDSPGSKTIRLEAHTTKLEQIKLVKSLFNKYGHIHSRSISNKTFRILCFLDESFIFLLPKKDSIEEWIVNDRDLFFSFLAGYVDAEGHFGMDKRWKSGMLKIQTQDRRIIHSIQKNLVKFGIDCPPIRLSTPAGYTSPSYPDKPNNKDKWEVSIHSARNLEVLLDNLMQYLRHEKRKSDAMKVLNHIKGGRYVL